MLVLGIIVVALIYAAYSNGQSSSSYGNANSGPYSSTPQPGMELTEAGRDIKMAASHFGTAVVAGIVNVGDAVTGRKKSPTYEPVY